MKTTYITIEKEHLTNFKAACSMTRSCYFNRVGAELDGRIVVWIDIEIDVQMIERMIIFVEEHLDRTGIPYIDVQMIERMIIFELGRNFEDLIRAETI